MTGALFSPQNRKRLALILLMVLAASVSPLRAEESRDERLEVGLAWEGKSSMPERVLAGLQEILNQQEPRIRLDIRKELKSLEALEAAISDFEKSKKAMVILRSRGVHLLGRRGASIPAFIGAASDPVTLGVAERPGMPGPNITGVTYYLPARQNLESFLTICPGLKRILLLVEADHPGAAIDVQNTEAAARDLGISVRVVSGRSLQDLLVAAKEAAENEAVVLGNQAMIMDNVEAITHAAPDKIFFGLSEQSVEQGAMAGIVADDNKLGRMLGLMLVDHLVHGKPVAGMPIQTDPSPQILFNYGALEKQKEHVSVAIYQLAKSRQLLASILKGAPSGIGLVENRVLMQVNDYILNLTGYSREELIGKNTRMLYPTREDFEEVGRSYHQIAGKDASLVESRWLCKDGSIRPVLLSLIPRDRENPEKYATFTVLDITDRKRAEERFAKTFSSCPASLVVSEIVSGRFIDVNDRWGQMLGYSREEMIGRTSKEVGIWSDPGDRDRIVAKLQAQGFLHDEPIRFLHKSGEYRFALWSAEIINVEGREVLLSLILDETARRQAEEALVIRTRIFLAGIGLFCLSLVFLLVRLSSSLRRERTGAQALAAEQKRLQNIAGNLPGIMYQFYATPDGKYGISYLSERAAEILGFEVISGLEDFFPAFAGHVHPEDRDTFFASIRDAVAARAPWRYEFRFVKPSGHVVWFSGTSNPVIARERIVFEGLILDITERKRAEEALKESEQRFTLAMAVKNEGVWDWNLASNEAYFDSRYYTMAGYEPNEFPQNFSTWGEHVHPDDLPRCNAAIKDYLSGLSDCFDVEFRFKHKNGSWIWIQGRGRIVEHDEKGAPRRMIGTHTDITERRRAEEEKEKLQFQLIQAQKMEAIGQLAGGVAHDFNNLLGGIIGAGELMRIKGNLSGEQNEYLSMILAASESAGKLTQKLLAFSRKGAKASTTIDCAKVIQDTSEILKHTLDKNIMIIVENKAENTSLVGDDSLLQNALINIGINASHAMPQGGTLTFTLKNIDLDKTYCDASPFEIKPGAYLEISIRDTGCGMPPEILSHIFEPFFTTKEKGKGTGLGLAMVYGAVQKHGGAVSAYSEVGIGTVFHLYLPVSLDSFPLKTASETLPRGSETVLLIDDEELIRMTARRMLESLGYTVLLAPDGREGVRLFAEKKESIDLIILDMIMPHMGGREAFEQLKKIDPGIPLIIASGFAKEEDVEWLKEQGLSGFLQKPFRSAELASTVHEALHSDSTAG